MTDFAERLLRWHAAHGRHDLPWQHPRSAYRVWVSEIMLQQTQVSTVIPYFERWMQHFPDVHTLAAASIDQVLEHWAGLGYYARGRNLHAAARQIVSEHDGELPRSLEQLMALPGIGRSTAAAILAQAWDIPAIILDGNVKRVLARHRMLSGWPGKPSVEKQFWAVAESLTPDRQAADYTQAIMDLGATLCRRSRPLCEDCPVSQGCAARAAGRQAEFPQRKPRTRRPMRHTRMLIARNAQGEVLLERRPPSGIWGGLWCLPEVPAEMSPLDWCARNVGVVAKNPLDLPPVMHGFTHFELEIQPVSVTLSDTVAVLEPANTLWYNPGQPLGIGVPAPVSRILETL